MGSDNCGCEKKNPAVKQGSSQNRRETSSIPPFDFEDFVYPKEKEEWKERFDDVFKADLNNSSRDSIKGFISTELERAREEGLQSKLTEHADYFRQQGRQAERAELITLAEGMKKGPAYELKGAKAIYELERDAHNTALDDLITRLKNKQ